MEGGNPLVEYLTYGMIAVVLLALGILALRTAKFFLTLLAIPLTEAASRWAPSARVVTRWGERGARRDPTSWRGTLEPDADARVATHGIVPRTVRRGMGIGALLGALPGIWWAIGGALHAREAGASTGDILAALGLGIGLVAAAGTLLGGAIGAVVGLAVDATLERHGSRGRSE